MNIKDSESQSLKILMDKLIPILDPKKEILLAYLYGSQAKLSAHMRSDIDIGIFVNTSAMNDPWYAIKCQEELAKRYPDEKFDVRVINNRSIKFLYQVIFRNPCFIVRNRQMQIEFERNILVQWYDMQYNWDQFFKKRMELYRENT